MGSCFLRLLPWVLALVLGNGTMLATEAQIIRYRPKSTSEGGFSTSRFKAERRSDRGNRAQRPRGTSSGFRPPRVQQERGGGGFASQRFQRTGPRRRDLNRVRSQERGFRYPRVRQERGGGGFASQRYRQGIRRRDLNRVRSQVATYRYPNTRRHITAGGFATQRYQQGLRHRDLDRVRGPRSSYRFPRFRRHIDAVGFMSQRYPGQFQHCDLDRVRHRVSTYKYPHFRRHIDAVGFMSQRYTGQLRHRDLDRKTCQPIRIKHKDLDLVCYPMRRPLARRNRNQNCSAGVRIPHKDFDQYTCGHTFVCHTPLHKYKVACDPNIDETTPLEKVAKDIKWLFTNKRKHCKINATYSGVGEGGVVLTRKYGPAVVADFVIKDFTFRFARWGPDSNRVRIMKKKVPHVHAIKVMVPKKGYWYSRNGKPYNKQVTLSPEETKEIMIRQLLARDKVDWLVRMYPEEKENLEALKLEFRQPKVNVAADPVPGDQAPPEDDPLNQPPPTQAPPTE